MEHRRVTVDSDVQPRFTACYLRVAGGPRDGEAAFVEAHTAHALPRLLAALEAEGRRPEDVRWVVVTHAHLDHAAGASALMARCPNATLLAHPRAARHLVDPAKLVASATAVYGAARFAALYGRVEPIAPERVRALDDGASFELGDATLSVRHTAGHANHHFVVDDPATDTVYTGDTFGLVYPDLQAHGRFALPSTSPTNFDHAEAARSLDVVLGLGRRWVAPTHFDAWEGPERIAPQLRRFLDRAEDWVSEAADEAEDGPTDEAALAADLTARWWAAIHEEAPRFGEAERKLLALDVELNAQGLAFVAARRRKG